MNTTTAIRIFLNTWKNYNENGADGGFWIELPCDLDEALERLAKSTGEEVDEMEVFINDFETDINGLEISENTDILNLNDIAEQLKALDEYDLEKLRAILETDGGSIENALDNMDDYIYYANMTLEEVAYELVDECYDLPDIAQRYFDYAAFARDLGYDGDTETENGVICRG